MVELVSQRRVEGAWSVQDSAELYRIAAWSEGYFGVAEGGRLVARPDPGGDERIEILAVVEELQAQGLTTPVLLRFPDLLAHRIGFMHRAFEVARQEEGYRGGFLAVYPIKVNQQRTLVEEVLDGGSPYGMGLEVGSKPELLAAIARASRGPDRPIICNGLKDAGYIEAAILAAKAGRLVIPVAENAGELEMILALARRYDVRPQIGARVKLASPSTGRWRDSSGWRSKFGLSAQSLLALFARLQSEGMADCLRLLHCHPGSQIPDIGILRESLTELVRIYVELARMGAGLRYLDVGGGVGVDYQGRRASVEGSINYSLEEYASTVVSSVAEVCDQARIEHPTLVSESGRAMVAHHGVLVFEVLGSSASAEGDDREATAGVLDGVDGRPPKPIADLLEAGRDLAPDWLVEAYHAAVDARNEALQLFKLGYLSLPLRVLAERLFRDFCRQARKLTAGLETVPEELEALDEYLGETYFCNFSLFQSLPDSWAIRQPFPILPIHRLDERPGRAAMLADLTCDSDGRIDRFPDPSGVATRLPVHALEPAESYYLGAFLVGAYQETLGDLHNLFGETHVAAVRLEPGAGWKIELVVEGDTAREVLGYTGYDVEALRRHVVELCERAVAEERLTPEEGRALQSFYEGELGGYTYLER